MHVALHVRNYVNTVLLETDIILTKILLASGFAREIESSKIRSDIVVVLFVEGRRPIGIRSTIQGVGEPPIEFEVKERRYCRIRIHRMKDAQDFCFYLVFREGFYFLRIISLKGISRS